MLGLVFRLLDRVIALVEARLHDLARETAAEVRRVALVVVWTFVAFVFGTLAMLLLAATVIIAFWEEHRLMAAAAVTAGFLLVAAAAVFQVRKKLAQRNRISGG